MTSPAAGRRRMTSPAARPRRLAMWSGPRNISTAMMRAWGNRPDAAVLDEPFYGYYLAATGLDHPGRDNIIASQPSDWRDVVAALTGPVPGGKAIFYQKHMTHHLLEAVDRGWLAEMTNCFLIRDPAEVLASYTRVRGAATLQDLGLPRQVEIFEAEMALRGAVPPVLDARDVLEHPRALLERLCAAVGVPFDERMLSWPPGRRPTDGVWAQHWYANVEETTGFAPYRAPAAPLADALKPLAEASAPYYRRLYEHRMRP